MLISKMALKKVTQALSGLAIVALLPSCTYENPRYQFMPHMHSTQMLKVNRKSDFFADGASGRVNPEGTVPRNFFPYAYANEPEKAALLKNPLPATEAVLNRGKKVYDYTCIVCHGPLGQGDGSIIGKFPKPPILTAANAVKMSDGAIFHLMTMGRGLMASYASQISSEDRWAIVHYIRALQQAKNASEEDYKKYQEGH